MLNKCFPFCFSFLKKKRKDKTILMRSSFISININFHQIVILHLLAWHWFPYLWMSWAQKTNYPSLSYLVVPWFITFMWFCRPLWRWSLENSCWASWCLPVQIPFYWLCEQNIPPKCWWAVSTSYAISQSFFTFFGRMFFPAMQFLCWSGLAIDYYILNF